MHENTFNILNGTNGLKQVDLTTGHNGAEWYKQELSTIFACNTGVHFIKNFASVSYGESVIYSRLSRSFTARGVLF